MRSSRSPEEGGKAARDITVEDVEDRRELGHSAAPPVEIASTAPPIAYDLASLDQVVDCGKGVDD